MKTILIFLLFPLPLFAQHSGTIKLDSMVYARYGYYGNLTPAYPNVISTLEMNYHPWDQYQRLEMVDPDRIKKLEDKVKELEVKIDLLIQLIKKE